MSDSRAFDCGDLAGGAGTQPEALEWNQALTTQLRAHQAMWIINKTPGLMTSPRESQKKRGPWTRHDCSCGFRLYREFPGGLVVRIPSFHCCGLGSVSGWGAEILHAAWHGQKKTRFRVLVKCRFLISKSGVEPEILHF